MKNTEKQETLGSRIKRLRKEKGWSQEVLARKSNLSYVNLMKIEQGKIQNPGIQAIYKISKSLEIEIGDIVNGVFNDEILLNPDK